MEATVTALLDYIALPTRHAGELRAVMFLYHRARAAEGVRRPGRTPFIGQGAEGRLQEQLWSLIRSSGLTLQRLAYDLHMATSTLSDALRHPHRLSPHVLQHLAYLCRVRPEPLLRAVEELAEARRIEAAGPVGKRGRKEARRRADPAPPVPHPPGGPACPPDPPSASGSSGASPADLFVEAVLARSPAELAVLVAGLYARGRAEFAARVVKAAVASLSVADATALALALLAADPGGAAAAGADRPPDPAPAAAAPPSSGG
ncbi:hypothetical protein [Streptomyces sp. NPDC089919]|uniref:hypothetical protein n=1 Tax=Streptomyces sp. NPDC089919 TaxID=3155188 RepID=UPI003440DD43